MVHKDFSNLTKSAGLAEIAPVGSCIANPLITIEIYEGLNRIWLYIVQSGPIVLEHSKGLRQNMRSQVLDANPWQNEKSVVIDHMGKEFFPTFFLPF